MAETTELRRRGLSSLWATFDEADAPLVSRHSWNAREDGRTTYAVANVVVDGRHTTLALHTLITGWPFVDHIDCDGLNNQRSNLRPSDRQRNMRNSRSKLGSGSRFKGVSWQASRGKWQAFICVDGKNTYLGRFDVEEEAARVYDNAARARFGDDARLNFEGALANG